MIGGYSIASATTGSVRDEHRIAPTTLAGLDSQSFQFKFSVSGVDWRAGFIGGYAVGSAPSGSVHEEYRVAPFTSAKLTARAHELMLSFSKAQAIADALDSDVTYYIRNSPRLVVDRNGDSATVKVPNRINTDVKIYRADEYRSNFNELVTVSAVPYQDTGLTLTTNYKYKVSFVISGTKAGNPHEVESRKSETRYTIGE